MATIIDNIPNEYKKVLGEITILWAYLEWCIDFLIWAFIGLSDKPSKGVSITSHLTFSVKYYMAMTLTETYLSETKDLKKFDLARELLNEADKLRVTRNKICHTAWFFRENNISAYNFSARAKLKSVKISYNLDELNTFKNEVRHCFEGLFDLGESIIPESVEKRRSSLQKFLSLFDRGNHNQGRNP